MNEPAVTTLFSTRPDAYTPGTTVAEAVRYLIDKQRALTRRGMVIGVSGGVDSAVCAVLAQRAMPSDRIRLVYIPDKESSPASAALAMSLADLLGTRLVVRDITSALDGLGVYDDLARHVSELLGHDEGDLQGWKLVRTAPIRGLPMRWRIMAGLSNQSVLTSDPLTPTQLAYIVARMNYKQRLRMAVLYCVAQEHHFMVVGTANRVEVRSGFFVRHGDGAGDCFPLRHLFKSEVRLLAGEIGIPSEVSERVATSDTFSASQTQEEFFFGVGEQAFDYVLYGFEQRLPPERVASAAGMSAEAVTDSYADLTRRQPFLRYLLSYSLTEDH